jgi:hypothetical protein
MALAWEASCARAPQNSSALMKSSRDGNVMRSVIGHARTATERLVRLRSVEKVQLSPQFLVSLQFSFPCEVDDEQSDLPCGQSQV